MKKSTAAFICIFQIVLLLNADNDKNIETVVFEGTPEVQTIASLEGGERKKLSGESAAKNSVKITKLNGEYFWKTRDNRKLTLKISGIYYYFIEPNGGGYVKIELPLGDGKRTQFFENVSIGMATITYFGTGNTFAP